MENSELIPKETLVQLDNLDKELVKVTGNLSSMLDVIEKSVGKFAKYNPSVKELRDNIEEFNKATEQSNVVLEQQRKLMDEREKVQKKVIESSTKEAEAMREVRTAYEESTKAADLNGKTLKDLSKDAYKQASKEIDAQREALVRLNAELKIIQNDIKKVDKEYKNHLITADEYIKRKTQLTTAEQDQKAAIQGLSESVKLNDTIINTTIGSYDNLSAQYSNLKIQINQMSDSESRNGRTKKELEAHAKALYEEMSNLQKATGKSQLDVGKYDLASKKLIETLKNEEMTMNQLKVKAKELQIQLDNTSKSTNPDSYAALDKELKETKAQMKELKSEGEETSSLLGGKGVQSILSYAAAVAAVKKGLDLYESVMVSNRGTAVEYTAVIDGLSAAFDYLKTSVADWNFDNVWEGMKNAFTLSKEASKMFENVHNMQNSFKLTSAPILAEIEELKTQLRDVNLTNIERIKIGDQIVAKTKKLSEEESKIYESNLKAAKTKLDAQAKFTDAELEFIIVNRNAEEQNIKNLTQILYLEKDLARARDNAQTYAEYSNDGQNSYYLKLLKQEQDVIEKHEKSIEKAKSVYGFTDPAQYELMSSAMAKFASTDKKAVDAYVEARVKMNDVDIKTTRELRQTHRLIDSLTKKETRGGSKEAEAFRKSELKAEQDLAQLKLQTQIDAEKLVLSNNKVSYEGRLFALDEFVEKQKDKIEQARMHQLSDKSLGDKQRELIEVKAQAESAKIDQEAYKLREGILKDHISKQNSVVENGLVERNSLHAQREQEDNAILLNKLKYGYVSQEEYERERTKLTADYAQLRLQSEIEAIQKMLEVIGISEEEKTKLSAKMKKAELDFSRSILDQQVNAEKEAAKKREEIEKQLAETKKKLYQETFNFIDSMVKGHTDRQLNELDKQSENNQKYRDEELDKLQQQEEAGLYTKEQADAQKMHIEEGAKLREAQIEEEKKKILERQAKYEKAAAITQIAINTAAAVVKNNATLGFLLAQPINALTIALGTMQASIVAAQPIPKYARGTGYHDGGLAVVGDGGRHELIRLPSGELFKTPKTDTLIDLPKGSQVMPDFSRAISEMSILRHHDDNKIIVIQENKQGLALAEKNAEMVKSLVLEQRRTNRRLTKPNNNINTKLK